MTIDTRNIDGTSVLIDDTYLARDQVEIDKILERIALIYADNEETFNQKLCPPLVRK